MNSSNNTPAVVSLAAFTSIAAASLLSCVVGTVLVFFLRLYRRVVYRLALYQVLSGLSFSIVELLQLYFMVNPDVHSPACVLLGYMVMYSQWAKLLSVLWVTFHLFCLAVLYKNMNKLELLYVITSLLIPAVIAAIPFISHSYTSSGYCYLKDNRAIEMVALWNAPAMILLFLASTAMVVMVVKLACTAMNLKAKYVEMTRDDQNWRALKQLLPLAAFPVLFFVFMAPVFVINVNNLVHSHHFYDEAEQIAVFVFLHLWSLSSGLTLNAHILVAMCFSAKKNRYLHRTSALTTVQTDLEHISGHTYYSFPPPSV